MYAYEIHLLTKLFHSVCSPPWFGCTRGVQKVRGKMVKMQIINTLCRFLDKHLVLF